MIEESLYKLQKYMVTPEDIFSNKEYNIRLKLKKEDNLILINEKNTLFWLYYIIKYGYEEYNNLERKKFIEQEKEKYKNIELFNNCSAQFKLHKLKKINIVNNLLYETVNIPTLKALCIYNNLSIILEYKYTYIELLFGNEPKYIYKQIDNTIWLEPYSKKQVDTIHKTKIEIKQVDKKINGIGYYKVPELHEMANKLSISILNNNKKKKKEVLYNEIKFKLNKL
jgi:hypothetical protein